MHGHQVTVVTTIPANGHPSGVTEIVVSCQEFSDFMDDYAAFMVSSDIGVWDSLQKVAQGGEALMKVFLAIID